MDSDIYKYEITKTIKELEHISNNIKTIALCDMEEVKKLVSMGYNSDNNSKILCAEESIQDGLMGVSDKIQSFLKILKK